MGLENREYLRDEFDSYGGSGRSAIGQPMWKVILITTVVVFVLQIMTTRPATSDELNERRQQQIDLLNRLKQQPGQDVEAINEEIRAVEQAPPGAFGLGLPTRISVVQEWLQLDTSKVLKGQIWRLLTCALCHDRHSVGHILFNMLFLYWFGRTLESMYGSREFLWFYVSGALAASLAYIAIDLFTGDWVPMIGASGAVMAVTMLFAVHFPRQIIYIFFIFPVEIRWVVLFYVVYDLHPVLLQLSGDPQATGVAHAAHLGGLAFGYVYAQRSLRISPLIDRWLVWWKGRRRGFRVVGTDADRIRRREDELTEQMDALLKKISEQGEASLTNSERRTLERVSRELRNRRL
ncbi:MAG: rhomboid family intramembrane serine protease [Planctomycetaceae bacterium]|nr:rhomboid family intramembrane serine protease [Planctomycetaceae bacterium]